MSVSIHHCHPKSTMRSLFEPILLSTLPHALAIYWALQISPYYAILIGLSTIASVLWHINHEPKRTLLFYIDYGLAGIWTTADIILAIYTKHIFTILIIIVLNAIALITNQIELPGISYETTHALWHCISWFKCSLVAYILTQSI